MMRNTFFFIVRDGDWKKEILRPERVLVVKFCYVILSSEENCNNMAGYNEALLKSKKFNFDERSTMDV